ncbi:MAG: HAMP domain-containing protein [Nitrospirae bacterium]|nr:MAG: HAMP domain-containing protein [Nitrospirota bacterium]
MKTSMTLQQKSIAIVAGILFIILAINTAVLTYIASHKYEGAILSKTTAIGDGMQRELAKVLSLGVPIESMDGVNEKMKDLITRDKAIGYAMVVDITGRVLYHQDPNSTGKELKDPATKNIVASDKPLVQTVGSFYDLSFPLLNAENKVIGALRVGVHLAAIKSQLYTLLLWAVGISSLCFLLSLGLVYLSISRFITKPILVMEKAADRMASGDLTYVIKINGDDELASLGKAINRMAMNLKDMLSKIGGVTNSVTGVTSNIASLSQDVVSAVDIQKRALEDTSSTIDEINNSISKVATSAENLSESANDTSSSILEMSASIERVAENANIFSETAHDTASSIEEMISTIKQIAGSIDNLSSSSEDIASSIDEVNATTRDIERRANDSVGLAETVMTKASDNGMHAAAAAMNGIEDIKKSVVALSDVINMLGKRTNDIGKILNVIDDVADQTNLLALNAAILASKAGEHGKGFTIVADEIKSLAERASVSTSEIASLIKSVQDVTKSSIRMASDGIQTVEKGLLLVQDVSNALTEIVDSSKESTEMARAIQRATAEEVIVLKQITDAIGGMTEQTETISRAIQEQSKGSRFIIEATERVKELSSQVKTATSDQKDGSKLIAHVIENVTDQASQIANATNSQKEKSIRIVQAMDKMMSTTGNLIHSSNEMNLVISSLREEAMNMVKELHKFKV